MTMSRTSRSMFCYSYGVGPGPFVTRPPSEPHAGGRHQELPLLATVTPYLDPLLMALPSDANRSHATSLSCVSNVKLWFDDEHHGTRRFYLFSLARVPTPYRLHWNPPSPPET